MPPPLFDDMQIDNALQSEALPALELLTQNPSLRDRALLRFDRDEPPPYASSTEDDYEDILPLGPVDSTMLDELNRHLNEPLNDRQRDAGVYLLKYQMRAYDPGARYEMEVKLERERVSSWAWKASDDTRDYFVQLGPAKKIRAGHERCNIIARSNIRRRWQKLGVWNPEWGFPGRADPQPNDDTYSWKWSWEHGDAAAEWRDGLDPMSLNSQHPITRAFQLRKDQRRGEHSPVLPRSRLGEDASASQAESFIISRPWFIFAVENCEEAERYARLTRKEERLYEGSAPKNTRELWKQRGDWNEDWRDDHGNFLIGWKWRHESPSPEPEDLSGLDDLATFDLTPSEVDELEAVRPPSPPTPPRIYIPPAIPGPGFFLFGGRLEELDGRERGEDPGPGVVDVPESPVQGHIGAFQGPPATPPAAPERTEQPPARRQRRRPHPGQQLPAQPLRRSPRIAQSQPLRRSPRIAARIAAMTANQPAPSRVSKPPARAKRRPRKNTAQQLA